LLTALQTHFLVSNNILLDTNQMNTVIIGLGILLIVAIILMIFRVQSLIAVVRGDTQTRANAANKVNAVMFPIWLVVGAVLAVYSSWEASKDFLPEPSSEHGHQTDNLFWITMAIIGVAFVITHILLFYFPYRYQFKEGRKALFYHDNTKLELIWTAIPAVTMAVLIFGGVKIWSDVTADAPDDSVVLEIMGKQFNWEVRYPGADNKLGGYNYKLTDETNVMGINFGDEAALDDFMPANNEIHIPVNHPVLFRIRARDVLHSVFLPHFRQKMDAVPGMPTRFWFTPTKTTAEMRAQTGNPKFNYEIACTEICGRGHFAMRYVLVVEEEDEYRRWYNNQKPWLASRRDYLEKIPANMREKALRIIGPGEGTASVSTPASQAQVLTVSNK
jgi:cytochrome c oxidase subunit 2